MLHYLHDVEEYKGVEFDAIVYPMMGSDDARELMGEKIRWRVRTNNLLKSRTIELIRALSVAQTPRLVGSSIG